MQSALPKVLHALAGRPLLAHVIAAARGLLPRSITIVHGHGGEQVRAAFADDPDLDWVRQASQLGTGHAVLQALAQIAASEVTLVLYGDVPLIESATLTKLVEAARRDALAWLTATVVQPAGLGRIVRDAAGQPLRIVEEKDATEAERRIAEINTGILACKSEWLVRWLPTLGNANAQGEYYLTDIFQCAVQEGIAVQTFSPRTEWEIAGVNSRDQLAQLERTVQMETAKRLMEEGVSLADPARIDVRGTLACGRDVRIDVNVVFEGSVMLADNVSIGAHCILRDCRVAEGTEILPFSFIDGATIGRRTRIGPYARIRPGTTLADEVHIGNFVEVKASEIGAGSKANHLAYVGDANVGRDVNIGAGTITCNYDGANKHRTVIEDNVHIGSDVQLVAPVTVKAGSTVAAGTTVWKDTVHGELTLNPKTQTIKPGWIRPTKKK